MYKDATCQIDLENLDQVEIGVLKQVFKNGTAHLKYFFETNIHFKFPERRMKTADTVYYEKVIPIVAKRIKDLENAQLNQTQQQCPVQ
jgi:hypothetical protein